MVTATNQAKPNTNQTDGVVHTSTALPPSSSSSVNLPNQFNENKKDTTNTTISTLNNSSHSKIPVLNPTARSIKCSSWAGNDYPIAPDMNDLTPGNTTKHQLKKREPNRLEKTFLRNYTVCILLQRTPMPI